jgi:hypothetical protein
MTSVRGKNGMYYPNPPPAEDNILYIKALELEEED